MNIADASALLTYASAGDNRTVTREAALIWAETLDADMTIDDARHAINSHFANSQDYLKPANVNAIVRSQRAARRRDLPDVVHPRELADEPQREAAWERVWGDAVLAGHTPERALMFANHQFGISEDEPLALESGPAAAIKARMETDVAELIRKQSLTEADKRTKADEKRERYRRIREAEDARDTAQTPTPPMEESA